MPLRFWKKDKAEKGPEEAQKPEPTEEKEEAKEKPTPPVETGKLEPEVKKAEAKKPETGKVEPKKPEGKPAPPPTPQEIEAALNEAHAVFVDLGLTVPPTRPVFGKRVAGYPGGEAAFAASYRSERHRAVTRVLADWLGFRLPDAFEPDALLSEVNLRLSSFKLSIQLKDLTWLDKELNLRKAKLVMGDVERVVRFKDARDFVKSVNELIGSKKLAFLELETWGDDYAFLLVREPRWDKIAATEWVVVKAEQTAKGGECGECGAPVGKYWSDCLKCGAVFG
ncbi:MAG: hypothetical protein E6K19_09100 [Methanobacteriota archaeon]|nr:MAG: hypothetical protein E6K19_09100 [Euryarchaeota archaeon]